MASTLTTTEIYTASQGGQRDYTVMSAPETVVSPETQCCTQNNQLKVGTNLLQVLEKPGYKRKQAEMGTTSNNTNRQEFAGHTRLKQNFKPHSQSMVDFNYLKHQIKRTKCSSQEYAG